MKIYNKPQDLSRTLKLIKPNRIAVAFVGKGWQTQLGGALPTEIILSPTLGSNPFAIEDLMSKLGEENVFFLDKLHSKFYIGGRYAFLGSPNLSDNGFSQNGNHELGVLLTSENSLAILNGIFEEYKKAAKNAYPTPESKKNKLETLFKQWQESMCQKFNFEESSPNPPETIHTYNSQLNRIHVVWYISDGTGRINSDNVKTKLPELKNFTEDQIQDYFEHEYEMLEEDDIRPGDWILGWKSTQRLKPSINFVGTDSITWTYVHHVIPNGYTGTNYTKLAAQDPHLAHPPFPFDLTPRKTREAIIKILQSNQFPELLGTHADPWKLPANKVVKKFFESVRNMA